LGGDVIHKPKKNATICTLIINRGLLILAIALISLFPAINGKANAGAVLHFDPATLEIQSAGQGSVDIRLDEVADLYGLELHLQFDPSILEVVDADVNLAGLQIGAGELLGDGFVAVNQADNITGEIDFAVTLLNPAEPRSEGGVIGTITFRALKDGSSPLRIENAILATRDGIEIQAEWQDGAVNVSATGQASDQADSGESAPKENIDPLLIGAVIVSILFFAGAAVLLVMVIRKK
jgi:hypothetical protein